MVRCADDFVCVVQYAGDDQRVEKALKGRFERYGLEIHPDKSRVFSFGRFERENAKRQNRRLIRLNFLVLLIIATNPAKEDLKLGVRRVVRSLKRNTRI